MTENFFEKPFGMNVKLPTRTIQQGSDTLKKAVGGLFNNPFGEFFDQNKEVFNGDVYSEIEKYDMLCFNIGNQLRKADVNAPKSLDTKA